MNIGLANSPFASLPNVEFTAGLCSLQVAIIQIILGLRVVNSGLDCPVTNLMAF